MLMQVFMLTSTLIIIYCVNVASSHWELIKILDCLRFRIKVLDTIMYICNI